MFNKLWPAALALLALVGFSSVPAHAGGLPPNIAAVPVHHVDPYDGRAGSPLYAVRVDGTVWYTDSPEHCADLTQTAKAKAKMPPARDAAITLVAGGVDLVEALPNGVHVPDRGAVVAGDPSRFAVRLEIGNEKYLATFSSEANTLAFAANPAKFLPPEGVHCILAMSKDRVVPGDLRYMRYYFEKHTWVTFGGAGGPPAWDAMSSTEHWAAYAAADANYLRRFGPPRTDYTVTIILDGREFQPSHGPALVAMQ